LRAESMRQEARRSGLRIATATNVSLRRRGNTACRRAPSLQSDFIALEETEVSTVTLHRVCGCVSSGTSSRTIRTLVSGLLISSDRTTPASRLPGAVSNVTIALDPSRMFRAALELNVARTRRCETRRAFVVDGACAVYRSQVNPAPIVASKRMLITTPCPRRFFVVRSVTAAGKLSFP
jgi:hypothetical protein